jgi:hypothetical protein
VVQYLDRVSLTCVGAGATRTGVIGKTLPMTSVYPIVTDNLLDSVVGGRDNLLTYWGIAGSPGMPGIMQGTIDPEGAITAKQGATYHRWNGDASAVYLKQTGAGNTGWVAVTVP